MKQSALFIYTITVGGFGSGFQHGWGAAVLNAPSQVIQEWIKSLDLSYYQTMSQQTFYWGFVQSVFTIGGIVGGFLQALFIMIGGRKGALMINDIVAIIAGLLMYITKIGKDPTYLVAGRFLHGVNCGANGALCAIYLTELSPVNLRGAVGSLYQLYLTFALMLATIFGIEPLLGKPNLWPYLFIFVSAVGLFQFLFLIPCPESAKYILDKKDDEEKARKAFDRLHGKKETAQKEFDEIKAESAGGKAQPSMSVRAFCSQKMYWKPFWLCFFLMVAQQFSGINAIIFYSTDIFRSAKLSLLDSQLCTVAIGVVNFLMTVISVFVVDKVGRKPLLLYGFIVMAISTAFLIGFLVCVDKYPDEAWLRWPSLFFILVFICAFAIGAGPIPWMFGSEVFYANARPIAYAFLVPTNWFFNLIVCLCFPPLQVVMGAWVFLIFLGCQIASALIIQLFLPETKNRAIEEIIQTEFS